MEHPLPLPEGHTQESLLEYLTEFQWVGADERIQDEFGTYLREDFKRFVHTLGLIPPGHGTILEIGSQPYYTSILITKFTDYHLHCTNYFGETKGTDTHRMRNTSTGEVLEFDYVNCNIEEDSPHSLQFDVVLCCEVIEHLTMDPVGALIRMKEMLKPNGYLVLTTPNVNRLENVAKMLGGVNIHDPYSAYGVYGRHNREFNEHELYLMLTHLGFQIEAMFSSDVHPNRAESYFAFRRYRRLIEFRSSDLGQYIFLRSPERIRSSNLQTPLAIPQLPGGGTVLGLLNTVEPDAVAFCASSSGSTALPLSASNCAMPPCPSRSVVQKIPSWVLPSARGKAVLPADSLCHVTQPGGLQRPRWRPRSSDPTRCRGRSA